MWRRVIVDALLLAALALLAVLAWATQNPRSPLLDAAAELPGVGPAVGRFLELYRPPPAGPVAGEAEPEFEIIRLAPPPRPAVGAAAEDDPLAGARPRVWVVAGTPLRAEPWAGAGALLEIDVIANLELLERRGPWHRVRYGEHAGWVRLEREADRAPVLGAAPEAPRPLPGRPPDPERLAYARSLFAAPETAGRLGAYALYTDAGEAAELETLAAMAADLERVYERRYGARPVCCAREVVLLYSRRESYLELQASDEKLAELATEGLSGYGLVATFLEGRSAAEVAATLVHELAHLLNRRALGPALPPWLDEGIADDLAYSRLSVDGRLLPGTLGGVEIREGNRIEWRGGRAAAESMRRAIAERDLPPLETLLGLDWKGFVGGPRSQLHYAQSAFLVRYALDPGRPRLGGGFRAFLAHVAAGGPATPEALYEKMELDPAALDAGWREWLAAGVAG